MKSTIVSLYIWLGWTRHSNFLFLSLRSSWIMTYIPSHNSPLNPKAQEHSNWRLSRSMHVAPFLQGFGKQKALSRKVSKYSNYHLKLGKIKTETYTEGGKQHITECKWLLNVQQVSKCTCIQPMNILFFS